MRKASYLGGRGLFEGGATLKKSAPTEVARLPHAALRTPCPPHTVIILHTASLHRRGDAVFGEGALPKKSAPTEVARLLHAALRTPS